MDTEQIVTIVVAVAGSGFLGAIINGFIGRRKAGADTEKAEAEAADQITKTALLLIDPLEKRIATLRLDLERTQDDLKEAKAAIEDLTAKYMQAQLAFYINTYAMQEAGIEPPVTVERLGDLTTGELVKMAREMGIKLPGGLR